MMTGGGVCAGHVSEATGRPLLSAAQIAAMYGVQPKTVHAWEARGKLHAAGLDERGVRLFDALDAALAEAAPRSRARRKNQLQAVICVRVRLPAYVQARARIAPSRPPGGCGRRVRPGPAAILG